MLVSRCPAFFKPISESAIPILFQMIAHCSQIPFVNYAEGSRRLPDALTYDQLLRGVATQLPEKNPLSRGGNLDDHWMLSRKWTKADYLKRAFQGLAYLNAGSVAGRSPDSSIYPGPRSETDDYYVDVSAEDPEMTDMLDTLSATPPGNRHTMAPRAWYKPVAESLIDRLTSLKDLSVRKSDLLAVIKLILVLPTQSIASQVEIRTEADMERLDAAAAAILRDFGSEQSESIDWATWIEVMSKSHVSAWTWIELNRADARSSPIY